MQLQFGSGTSLSKEINSIMSKMNLSEILFYMLLSCNMKNRDIY